MCQLLPGQALRSPSITPVLRHLVQRGIEQEGAAKLGTVAGFSSPGRLQTRRQGLIPFPCKRRDIAENARQLIDTYVAGIGNRIETCTANHRIANHCIRGDGPLGPPPPPALVSTTRTTTAGLSPLLTSPAF